MLFTPFNKSWWKTLAKGDQGQEIPVVSIPEDDIDDETPAQLSKPLYPNENIVNEESDSDQSEDEPYVHEGGESPDSSSTEVDTENPYDLKGFELEQDEPSQEDRSRDKRRPRRGPVQSPRDFFSDDILYRYDMIEEPERSALKGSYRLELKGQQGGVWTVRIDDAVEVLNRREDADVVLSVQHGDFLKLVNGQLNPQIAILSKKLRVTGDLKQAMAFNSVICPSDD
jgi:putative sterol carrier protein